MKIKPKTIYLNGTKLYVNEYTEYYFFEAPRYGMELKLYKEDILKFIKNPIDNFEFRKSSGNRIREYDRDVIVKFLRKKLGFKKYKTISRCLAYSKKDKLIYNLNLFSIKELYEYLKT